MKKVLFSKMYLSSFVMIITGLSVFGQFPGPVGSPGSTAMYKDSSAFINWASECTINRGLMNSSNPSSSPTSSGTESDAIGVANGSSVVSLGDGGSAILTFTTPIINGSGYDFAVFENSFNNQFLELAFVEVSSDGINFFRFLATSNIQDTMQIGPFDQQGDAAKLDNLAGKYRASYGTPFDLEELDGTQGLDVMNITHIKVIDVVGSIDPLYASYDQHGNAINDPFPTDFASGGFDLDAVGVIHQSSTSGVPTLAKINETLRLAPNPAHSYITVFDELGLFEEVSIFSTTGKLLLKSTAKTLSIISLPNGVYIAQIQTTVGIITHRIVKN